MGYSAQGFRYAADLSGRINGKSFYWRVPADLARKEELFAAFRGELWFPEDAPTDWDALFEALRDFSWMSDRTIVLVHEALPRLPEEDLQRYLSILRDAVRSWSAGGPRHLEVVFPEAARERIARLLPG